MARKGKRDPKREQFWRATLQRRQQSGLTVREFCRVEQLPETAYHFWQREIARREREPQARQRRRERAAGTASRAAAQRPPMRKGPLFQELAIVDGALRSGLERGLEIVLPDGCQVRVPAAVDCAWLTGVLQALEARRC